MQLESLRLEKAPGCCWGCEHVTWPERPRPPRRRSSAGRAARAPQSRSGRVAPVTTRQPCFQWRRQLQTLTSSFQNAPLGTYTVPGEERPGFPQLLQKEAPENPERNLKTVHDARRHEHRVRFSPALGKDGGGSAWKGKSVQELFWPHGDSQYKSEIWRD